jgi:RNA polymerase sigma-70 factor, ECF subfamily
MSIETSQVTAVALPEHTVAAYEEALRPLLIPGYDLAFAILRDSHLAEDAVQEAAYKAWRSWGRFTADGGSTRAWFLKIVLNQCRSMMRTPWWRLGRGGQGAAELPTAVDAVTSSIHRLDLERAIRRLRPEHREVLFLFFVLDLPQEEIASVIDVRVGTVKSRLHRALERLRSLIAQEEPYR